MFREKKYMEYGAGSLICDCGDTSEFPHRTFFSSVTFTQYIDIPSADPIFAIMDFTVVGFPHAFIRDEGTVGVADLNNPSDILPTVSVEFQGLEYEAANTLSGVRSAFGRDIAMHDLEFDLAS